VVLDDRVLAGGVAVVGLEPHAVKASEPTKSTPRNRNQKLGSDDRIGVNPANCATSNHDIALKLIVAQRNGKWKPNQVAAPAPQRQERVLH
jgi:hypothetical protein